MATQEKLNEPLTLQITVQAQTSELQTLQITVQAQTSELQTLQITVQTQTSELQTLQTTVQTQTSELQTLQTTVQAQTSELQTLQITVQTQTSELQTLQTTVQAQTSELQTLQTTVQAQTSELQTLQTTVQTQTSELHTLRATVQTQNAKLQNQNAELQTQNGKISSLEQRLYQASQDKGGATFIRWGRIDCPANLTDLVYSGYAGGTWYAHTGAAANHVCLPRDPVWGPYKNMHNTDYTALMYGAEYNADNTATPFGLNSHDEEVPCAVCRYTSFVSSVMIPARTTCYSGWTKAYSGSLAAGYFIQTAASEYVCVDEHAQLLDRGADTNDDGTLFLAVKAQCGSLRCPPYEQDKYLSCVVCMK
ncbi:Chromosome partition protein Smc [Mizuhopecten yessoensis]|uniref:Chromosome partition protein Smc n=1 Tax=Mizuhopecten yessoensis TaxID=6573 RepID=A0A210QQV8_MIZYE|nr:Chromosome partition protein Smc [Mizuhopecten yessoensis]